MTPNIIELPETLPRYKKRIQEGNNDPEKINDWFNKVADHVRQSKFK